MKKLYLNEQNNNTTQSAEAYEHEHDELWEPYLHKQQEETLNETIVTLRLTKKHYRTAHMLAYFEGYDSFDEYISHVVVQSIECDIGNGAIDIDRKKLL